MWIRVGINEGCMMLYVINIGMIKRQKLIMDVIKSQGLQNQKTIIT